MKGLLLSSYIVIFLLSQWGLESHAYQEHDDGSICELCLVSHSHDDVLISSSSLNLQYFTRYLITTVAKHPLTLQTSRYYHVRAPPINSVL